MDKSFEKLATKKDEAGTAVPCQPWNKDSVSDKTRAEEAEEKLKKVLEETMEEFQELPELQMMVEGIKKRNQCTSTSSSDSPDESEDEAPKDSETADSSSLKVDWLLRQPRPPCTAAMRRAAALTQQESTIDESGRCSLCGSYGHVLGGRIDYTGPSSKRYACSKAVFYKLMKRH